MRASSGLLNPSRSGSVPMFDLFKRKSDADERKSWRERLADGLGRSREKLVGSPGVGVLATNARRRDAGGAGDGAADRRRRRGRNPAPARRPAGSAGRRPATTPIRERLLKAALVDLLAPLEWPLVVSDAAPVRDHARRRQRRGQDDVDRQARQALPGAGPVGAARRRRHVSRRGARAARRLGRAQRRRGHLAAGRRSGGGDVRRHRGGEGARHRRRARRHRGAAADAAAPDGRDPQGPPRDREGRPGARRTRRCWCSTRTPARTRWRR